jgi:O-antigen ligase
MTVVPRATGTQVVIAKDSTSVVIGAGHLLDPPSLQDLGLQTERARPLRARGTYSHFITYSDEMQMLLALGLGLCLSLRRPFALPAWALIAATALFAVALGATLSRSAWLAAALACFVQIWFHVRRRMVRILLPVGLILAAFATHAAVQHWRGVSLIDPGDPSTSYRLLMWRDSVKFIRENPLLGLGMNRMRDAWPDFDLEAYRLQGERSHFHSTPIQYAVEMGLPVVALWMVFMGAYWKLLAGLVASARNQSDPQLYGLSLGMLGGTTGFLANSLVQYNFGDSVVVMLFWFLMGLALVIHRHLASTKTDSASLAQPE